MHYQNERTFGCRISDSWAYRGNKTVVLENELVRILILVDKGADIYSFVHKPTDTEFLWRSPWGVRDTSKFIPSTGDPVSVWLDLYEGGWQTVVPHGGYPDTVSGADMGLHGDVNTIPWDCRIEEDSPKRVSVTFVGESIRTPFKVKKTLTLEADSAILQLDETVINQSDEPQDCVWLEHIAIGPPFLSEKCRLYVPEGTRILSDPSDTDPNSKLVPGFEGPWPNVPLKDGTTSDFSTIPPRSDRSLDMAYMTGADDGWYAILNRDLQLGWVVNYPSEVFKYLWYWRNYAGGMGYPWYGRCFNAGLEPCTSFGNAGVTESQDNGTARRFRGNESIKVTLFAGAFTGNAAVIGMDGKKVITS